MYWYLFWPWNVWAARERIWACEPADAGLADELAAIHASCFARGWSVEEMDQLLSDDAVVACALHMEGRGRPVGFAASRIAADEAEVLSVAIRPRFRQGGGGSALFGHHLGRLAARGVRRVVLEVDEENASAIALYARFGFVQVGKRKAYYARADGGRGSAKVLALEMR
ncbi:GNAT family N-acetyltransferase [Methylopila henanensis]|uniref:GNAT family N-acetyltransferase n=1 Tax=Methylopila henanensis TaxID=873516 RepID=A0ABW4K7Q8_9HYPH